jgi:predicted nuclease of restriction endonuclease-like (RecB) superfamily
LFLSARVGSIGLRGWISYQASKAALNQIVRTASGEMSRTRARAAAVSRVIDRLAADLRRDFPEKTGLSPRNLKHMRAFGEAFPDEQIVQQLVAQLPWGHNVKLVEALKSDGDRLWSVHQAVEHGLSRNVLVYRTNAARLQFSQFCRGARLFGQDFNRPGKRLRFSQDMSVHSRSVNSHRCQFWRWRHHHHELAVFACVKQLANRIRLMAGAMSRETRR